MHSSDLFTRATVSSGSPVPNAPAVFAHPDDETIARGASGSSGCKRTHFVHVSDGARRDQREIRSHAFAFARGIPARATEALNQAESAIACA